MSSEKASCASEAVNLVLEKVQESFDLKETLDVAKKKNEMLEAQLSEKDRSEVKMKLQIDQLITEKQRLDAKLSEKDRKVDEMKLRADELSSGNKQLEKEIAHMHRIWQPLIQNPMADFKLPMHIQKGDVKIHKRGRRFKGKIDQI